MTEETGEERPRFRVGAGAWAVLIFCGLTAAVMAMPAAQGSREVGEVAGRVTATVGLPLLIGWVVFKLGGRAAANPVIIFVAVASVFGAVSRTIERRKAVDNVGEKLRALEDSRDPEAHQKAAEEALGALEELGKSDPRVGKDMQVITRMLQKMQQPAEELNALAEQFLAAGGIKAASLPTLAAIDARIELVAEIEAKAALARDRAKNFVADGEAELRAGGVDPSVIEGFLSSAREQPQRLAAMVAMNESLVRYYAAVREMLGLLRKHHGAWSTEDGLTFAAGVPKADVAAYNRAHALLQTESQEQERLAQEIARAGK